MKITHQIDDARECLLQGNILAYPTEAVYGLGCDPFNQVAVDKLLVLKQRTADKGFILLIANWGQLAPLIGPISDEIFEAVSDTWPGPVTWVFPKSDLILDSISGHHESIAVRMTSHPVARALCESGPIISTSANLSGCDPARDLAGLYAQFPFGVDVFLQGPLGGLSQPSEIYDALSGSRLR
jgi:L-threonylcarbamoyladenylate synthase